MEIYVKEELFHDEEEVFLSIVENDDEPEKDPLDFNVDINSIKKEVSENEDSYVSINNSLLEEKCSNKDPKFEEVVIKVEKTFHNGGNDRHFGKEVICKLSPENYFCDSSNELNKSNRVIPRKDDTNSSRNEAEDKTWNTNICNSMLITPCSFLSKCDSDTSKNLQNVNVVKHVGKTDLNLSKQILEQYSSMGLHKELGQISKHILDSNLKQKKFMCGLCNILFSCLSTLKTHMELHTCENTFKCSVCDRVFPKPSGLKDHMRSHTGERPFKCSVCNKKYSRNGPLIIHMRTHTGERPFKCSLCDKTFTKAFALKEHERLHTGERPFKCSLCDKSFMKACVLKAHKRLHTGERPFCCSVCNKVFTQKIHLTVHMRIHTGKKPFTCSKCDKSFSRACRLQSHMRLHS